MSKVLNIILNVIKVLLLLLGLAVTLYIMIFMYKRLDKDLFGIIPIVLPFILLLILFSINFSLTQRSVNFNCFYNITCCLVFLFIIFAGYRAIFDDFMIVRIKFGNINYNYFADVINVIKALLYGLCFSNLLLMFTKDK